jgi:hypothetical protein
MGRKKIGGFIFETHSNDHRPYHIHVYYGGRFLGRFNLESKGPLDSKLKMTNKLENALKEGGYI